jgi:hypothetical protein
MASSGVYHKSLLILEFSCLDVSSPGHRVLRTMLDPAQFGKELVRSE